MENLTAEQKTQLKATIQTIKDNIKKLEALQPTYKEKFLVRFGEYNYYSKVEEPGKGYATMDISHIKIMNYKDAFEVKKVYNEKPQSGIMAEIWVVKNFKQKMLAAYRSRLETFEKYL